MEELKSKSTSKQSQFEMQKILRRFHDDSEATLPFQDMPTPSDADSDIVGRFKAIDLGMILIFKSHYLHSPFLFVLSLSLWLLFIFVSSFLSLLENASYDAIWERLSVSEQRDFQELSKNHERSLALLERWDEWKAWWFGAPSLSSKDEMEDEINLDLFDISKLKESPITSLSLLEIQESAAKLCASISIPKRLTQSLNQTELLSAMPPHPHLFHNCLQISLAYAILCRSLKSTLQDSISSTSHTSTTPDSTDLQNLLEAMVPCLNPSTSTLYQDMTTALYASYDICRSTMRRTPLSGPGSTLESFSTKSDLFADMITLLNIPHFLLMMSDLWWAFKKIHASAFILRKIEFYVSKFGNEVQMGRLRQMMVKELNKMESEWSKMQAHLCKPQTKPPAIVEILDWYKMNCLASLRRTAFENEFLTARVLVDGCCKVLQGTDHWLHPTIIMSWIYERILQSPFLFFYLNKSLIRKRRLDDIPACVDVELLIAWSYKMKQ